jgi:nucleoside-diphosphate-sugar epimerase
MVERKFLVTGADGFVGRALVRHLRDAGHSVVPVVRRASSQDTMAIGDIAEFAGWHDLLGGSDVVIHLAARAHVLRESASDPTAEFTRVNVRATRRLAEAAVASGVRRFVFLSSIGVNGSATLQEPFRESDDPQPREPYAISKWQAETALLTLAAHSGLEIVRVRPPLVVGGGVKGNLRRLLRWVDSGVPLPFGGLTNRRSFISLEDLCEMLRLCATDEHAAGELFLAAHPEPLSTPELLEAMAAGLGRRIWMPPVPLGVIRGMGRLLGRGDALVKMTSSLTVSSERAQRILGFRCRRDLAEDVKAMARAYRLDPLSAPLTSET